MKIYKIYILWMAFLILSGCVSGQAETTSRPNLNASQTLQCGPPLSESEVSQTLKSVVLAFFPELHQTSIELGVLDEEDYFFDIRPRSTSLLKSAGSRSYQLSLNPKVLNCPLPADALHDILIHELQHVSDYESWSSFQILGHLFRYVTSDSYRADYERQTDLKALERGAGQGLIQHRHWVYQWLTTEQLEIKKKFYLRPEEIEAWLKEHPRESLQKRQPGSSWTQMRILKDHLTPNIQPPEIQVEFAVLHYTACDLQKTFDIFMDPATKVSSHFVIDTNGDIYDLGNFADGPVYKGAHAGASRITIKNAEFTSLNEKSIGIEIINLNGNIFPYTEEQYMALKELLTHLQKRFPALHDSSRIIGHEQIAGYRGKADPGLQFDWPRLLKSIGLEQNLVHKKTSCDSSDLEFLKSEIENAKATAKDRDFWPDLSSKLELRIKTREEKKD